MTATDNKKTNISNQEIQNAVKYLNQGRLVCFPTETVYGLGANAEDDLAILKIYEIKNRPSFNPLIIHAGSIEMIEKIASLNDNALKLSVLWPGPITLVMKQKSNNISKNATCALDTIAIRIPFDNIAQNLLQSFGGYIAAPSANPSGYISPTKSEHVVEHYGNSEQVYIINSHDSSIGIESTIVDVSMDSPSILRPGFIDQETIEKLLGKKLLSSSSTLIKSPGVLEKHYAPNSKIRLNADYVKDDEIGIGFGKVDSSFHMNLSEIYDLKEACVNLYDFLRKADKMAFEGNKSIAISPIPNYSIGIAINDKLIRASK